MPVRKIPMSYSSVTGRYVLPDGSTVGFESTVERDFITLMVFDLAFVTMEEQPLRIFFTDEFGKRRRYTPDYLVTRAGRRPLLAEVKLVEKMTPEMEVWFDAGRAYSRDHGWDYGIWTDVDMRTPFLNNAKFLVPYRRRRTDPGIEARLLRELERREQISISDLLAAAFAKPDQRLKGIPILWRLIANGRVGVDLHKELVMASDIWHLEGEQEWANP